VTDEPVVYREEVLTIMLMLGDQRDELVKIRRLLEEEDGEEEAAEDPDA
jgi:hypothetical protein